MYFLNPEEAAVQQNQLFPFLNNVDLTRLINEKRKVNDPSVMGAKCHLATHAYGLRPSASRDASSPIDCVNP